MPFKQAFGSAALPAAGGAAIAIAAAIGYFMYVAAPRDDAAAPRDAETVAEAPPIAAEATSEVAKSEPVALSAPVLDVAEPDVPSVDPSSSQTDVAAASAEKTIPPVVDVETSVPIETSTEPEISATAQAPDSSEQQDVEQIAQTAPVSSPSPSPSAATVPETETEQEFSTPIEDVPTLSAPTVDIVRIPPDGISTVAGHADADVDILIFVDGVEVSRAKTGGRGDYVALFDIPAVDHPREMQIAAQNGETRVFANSSIVIAPFRPMRTPKPAEAAQIDVAGVEVEKTEAPMAAPAENETVSIETPVAPTVMVADDTGVKVLQTAAPLRGVSIDAITYDPDGAVFASGRGTSGTTVRLYLNNAAVTDTIVGADGQWRTKVNVAAGIYSLRADMVDETGKVLGRVEIPFKREDIAVLERLAQGVAQSDEPDLSSETQGDRVEATDLGDEAEGARSEMTTQGAPQARIASVTVQPGNTLWGIASDSYGDGFLYARVFNANVAQIRDPDLIYPGQVFVLPDE